MPTDTRADQLALILAEGWTQNADGSEFYHRDSGDCLPFHLAYRAAVASRDRRERAAARKAGTLDLRCNRCGEALAVRDRGWFAGYYGLVDATVSTGFFSDALPDCHTYRFGLCEPCLAELFKTFNFPVDVETYP